MNAGAYGSEFKDVTLHATGFDRQGNTVSATPTDMGMAYDIVTPQLTDFYNGGIKGADRRPRGH